MSRPGTGTGGSQVVRRQLGAKLRALRLKAGKDLNDVVEAGLASKAKISRIENGRGLVKIETVLALAWLYGADSATANSLAALAPATQQEDWWEPYSSAVVPDWFGLAVGLLESASRLRSFEPVVVHGLLATESHARAVIQSEDTLTPDVVEQRVRFRLDLQRRVLGNGPAFTVILGAGALSQVVGSAEIMAEQLDHLRQLNRDRVATIRVLPWSAGAYPIKSGFDILDFPDLSDPTCVYLEFNTGARYVEQPAQVAEHEHIFGVLMDRTVSIEEWK